MVVVVARNMVMVCLLDDDWRYGLIHVGFDLLL